MSQLKHHRILVAIETDATRYHGENPVLPGMLNPEDSAQLLAHIATDLAELLPDARRCTLSMAGAVHDQTRLLQPGFPMHSELEALVDAHYEGSDFQPSLISFGVELGHLPSPVLEPDRNMTPGLLLVLPLVVSGAPTDVRPLAEATEHEFMERGQLSPNSAQGLESLFDIKVNHARLMTLTDLMAMLRMQLENFGFLPLWELIDAALQNNSLPLDVATDDGHQFELRDNTVYGQFETFDHWTRLGRGKSLEGDPGALTDGYADWTRQFRQYLTTLEAHGVPFEPVLLAGPGAQRRDQFVIEHPETTPPQGSAGVTEHSAGDLGTVAITVVADEEQVNFYPLAPDGINQIQKYIREKGLSGEGTAFPGGICHDPKTRMLVPDLLTPPTRH